MKSLSNEDRSSRRDDTPGSIETPPSESGRIDPSSPIPQELLQHIPEDLRPELIQRVLLYGEQYSGPIPHPRIVAGSADRILKLSEQQQQHRFGMEERGQQSAILRGRVGIGLGFILGMALLALAAYAIAMGVALASVAFVGTSIASVSGVYIYSYRNAAKELQEKRNSLEQPSIAPSLPESKQAESSDPSQ